MAIYRGQGGAQSATDAISLNKIIELEANAEASASSADASAIAAQASATSASASEVSVTANASIAAQAAIDTAADVLTTNADAVTTTADALSTAADVLTTNTNAVITNNNALSTTADAAATAADRVQTGLDATATAADRAQTGLDASTATTQAGLASTSASDALTSASNASTSEANAAAYAATIPVFDPLTGENTNYPRVNAGETGIEFRTPAQVLTDIGAVGKTVATGSAILPSGTTAQRDATPFAGYFRFNADLSAFEGYNGTSWGSVGGGATGGGSDEIFVENGQTVTTDYTIPVGRNAMSTGDITINTGITVTVSVGSNWVVI